MRLSVFISENIEPILQTWEDFAKTIHTPGKGLGAEALRDHAGLMLQAIVTDLETYQSDEQQLAKSKGHGSAERGQSAAETHAVTRLMAGFSLDQMVSEYRALRASVLKLWLSSVEAGSEFESEDMIRFNEAIDQALSESIASYSRAVDASRSIFLGILGHDLRTPLGAILMGSEMLVRSDDMGERQVKISSGISASVKRSIQIVEDLLDFTRSQVGPGIPVRPEKINLVPVCEAIVEEIRLANPETEIVYTPCSTAIGYVDGPRIEQVFSNLIGNAIRHGDTSLPINIGLEIGTEEVIFKVHNQGVPIAEDVLPFIFNPMGRFSQRAAAEHGKNTGLGLGLFIAAEIVKAHDGSIDVTSDLENGTNFVVRLPTVKHS